MLTEFWCVKFLENDTENSIRIGEDTILEKDILVGDGDCNWKKILANFDISYWRYL
jgi:hypothetical protein